MPVMSVGELIADLQQYDESTPVLLAHQPSWPLAETLAGWSPEMAAALGEERFTVLTFDNLEGGVS